MRSPVARGIVWGLAIVVCIVAGYVSLYLALEHYRTPAQADGLLSRACTAFATASCEKVSKSRWAWFPPLDEEGPDKADDADKNDNGEDDHSGAKSADAGQPVPAAKDKKPAAPAGSQKKSEPRIPTAQLGLMYFTAALVWLVFTGPARQSRRWPYLMFLGATVIGVVVAGFFDFIMWTTLEAWCPLCLVTHVASGLMLVFALLLWPGSGPQEAPVASVPAISATSDTGGGLFAPAPTPMCQNWSDVGPLWPTGRVVVTTAIVALLLIVIEHQHILKYSLIRKAEGATATQEYFKKKWMQYERYWQHNYTAWMLTPPIQIPVEGRPVRGPENARHTIVVFSDFECPACAKFEKYLMDSVLPLQLKGQPGFKVIFKHWPLCKDCNDVMQGNTLHPAACEAAYAAEAARMLGGDKAFWEMHDQLFANQESWKKSRNFVPYAKHIGLDETAFVKAMSSSEVIARVREDIHDGIALGSELTSATRKAESKVDSTPTVFVDGKRLNSPQFANTWKQILNMPGPSSAPAATISDNPTGPRISPAPAVNGNVGPRLNAAPATRPTVQ